MNQLSTRITKDGEIVERQPQVDMALVVGLTRAEIDQQISTARQFPRSVAKASQNILALATLNEATAESCMYAVPRDDKVINGASIRLAEIIQQCWGNNRVAARVVFVDREEKYLEAEGVYHDLETNSATMARVRRRISTKTGKVYSDDMILMTGNAACSIARRNAILAGVPKPIWSVAYDEAHKVTMGDIKTLANRRATAITTFQKVGITAEQIFALLKITGEQDIDLERLATLRGLWNAISTGETTVEDVFGDILKTKPSLPRPKPEDFVEKKQEETVDPETGELGATQPEVPLEDVLAQTGEQPATDNRLVNARHLGAEAFKAGRPLFPPADMTDADEQRAYKAAWSDAEKSAKKAGAK